MTGDAALILIVDDDYDFLEINRFILEGAGYRVITATNPVEALARVAEEPPELVITDLIMTAVDSGFRLAGRLKDDPRTAGVPIIIATSVSSQLGLDFRPQSDVDLAKMHVDAYFDKPIPADGLLAKVRELLRGTP